MAYIAGLSAFGLIPRATLEIPTSQRRLERILKLIQQCAYSIHDLSRVQLDPGAPRMPRFNMPFELGLAVAQDAGNRPTASLAHEIKQPISGALTDARTCLRWLRRDEPDAAEASGAAVRLVTDVTRADIISRISLLFKKGALQHELVDVNDLIQEMIVLLRGEASCFSISIRSELATDLPKIMADRVQLQQVLMNLMLNGIEAMKDMGSGGELTIKSQQDDNPQLVISVGDTGVGLQPEEAEKVFNPFYTTKDQGTGMGLPISRSIIESHGGRLWARPNPGQGTMFQFTLPTEVIGHEAA